MPLASSLSGEARREAFGEDEASCPTFISSQVHFKYIVSVKVGFVIDLACVISISATMGE